MDGVTRIFDLLQVTVQHHQVGEPVFFGKKNDKTFTVDSLTYNRNSHILAHALLASGIKKGDRVATIINNRPEWNFFDMAISLVGAVQVPIYPTVSETHMRFIFDDAAISGLIINDESVWGRIKHVTKEIASMKLLISIDSTEGMIGMDDLLLKYQQYFPNVQVLEIAKTILPANLVSIIYTSGTTGKPKGEIGRAHV